MMKHNRLLQPSFVIILLFMQTGFPLPAENAIVDQCDSLFAEGGRFADCYLYDSAIVRFTQMLEMAGECDGSADSAAALNSIGEVYYTLYWCDTALAYFDSAVVAAKRANEEHLEAAILNNIGRCHCAKGDYGPAFFHCNSALVLASSFDDKPLIGRILQTVALAYAYSGKADTAFVIIDSALVIACATKDRKEEARALVAKGKFCHFTSEFDRGLVYCDSALVLARETGDLRVESDVLDLQGLIYCQLSQYDKAIACLDSCLTIDRNTVKTGHTRTFLSLEWAHRALAHWDEALALCDSAIAIARSMQDKREVASCLLYRAVALMDFSQFDAAISNLDSAHAIAEEINDTVIMTYTLGSLGESYLHQNLYERSLEHLVRAHRGARELNDVFLETGMKICIGLSYCGLNEYNAALAYLDSALANARKMNVVHYIAWCYQGIGSVYFKQGEYDKTLAYYDSAFVAFESYGYKNGKAMVLDQLGQTYENLGDPEKAIDCYKRSIEIRESIRKTLREEEFRGAYIKVKKDVYERLVILLIMLDRYEEAFDYLERSHSMKLRKAFEAGDIAAYDPSLRRILERINSLEAEIEGVRKRFGSGEVEETLFENTVSELEGKLNQRMLDLQIHHPELYNIMVPQRRTLKYVQELMPESTMFVEYVSIDEKYVVLLFSKDIFLVYSIEEPRKCIDSLVLHLLSCLQVRTEKDVIDSECAALYEMLMKPIENALEKFPNIVIIPYGVLHYLPFHILKRRDEYGSFEYSVEWKRFSYLPSASFLTDLFREKEQPEKELLAFGNADGSLPSAEIEVDFIAEIFPDACVYKAENARKEQFIELCGDYRLIHLATHGVLNTDPRFSYIVLAPPREGNLTVREILGLSGHFKRTSLVTLSACETAAEANPETAGIELVTLANAFKVAGVPTTLASLWEIADRSTAFLMRNFYENLKKGRMSKLEALRQAQIIMIKDDRYSHPYYWAPFVMIGDWR